MSLPNKLAELDAAIIQYVREFATKKGWHEVNSEHSALGASRDYRCGNLIIRVENDRGLIDLEIASGAESSPFRSLSHYMDWLEPAPHGRWNLGIEGEVKFLERHWDRLDQLLSGQSYQSTIAQVDADARRPR